MPRNSNTQEAEVRGFFYFLFFCKFEASLDYIVSSVSALETQRNPEENIGPSIVAHASNPSTKEAKADGSLLLQGQPDLQCEFQDS